jgi:hypothetical protein
MVRHGFVLVVAIATVAHAQPVSRDAVVKPAQPDALTHLLARTDAVAKEVAAIRGLPLQRPIPNEVVDRDELRRRLLAMAAEDKTRAETISEGLALARWGMIPLATDYEALLVDLLTEQIAGYYDPETKKLTISQSAGDDPQWAELVLAHELDHGLQDQAFDLKTFEDIPATEGDASAARRALVEGDGIALMFEVMLARKGLAVPWSNPTLTDSIEKAMAVPGNGDALDTAPLAIREAMIFPYRAGFTFVATLRRRQPWSAVDAAFAKPPRSTEQILHPERYLAGDQPIAIELGALPSLRGFTVAQSTVWGELGFQLFLRSHGVDARSAADAAAGWGGDRTIVLARGDDRKPERAVGISRSVWDSETDAIEAHDEAVKAIDASLVGAVVDHDRTRTRWLALDGTMSWVERKGASIVIVHGAPAWAAAALAADVWTASRVVAPEQPTKPTKPPVPKPTKR